MLLVIEDVQWGGSATLLLLRYLAGTLESSRVLLVLTYRDDEIEVHPEARLPCQI